MQLHPRLNDYLLLFLITLLIGACVSSKDLVSDSLDRMVPKNTERIGVFTEYQPDTLFTLFQRTLLKQGYRIMDVDKKMLSISTQARFLFYIEPIDGGSKLIGRAEWIPGSTANAMASAVTGVAPDSQWEKAKWSSGRPKRAMAAMVNVMNKIEHGSYDFKQ